MEPLQKLLDFLEKLDRKRIAFTLAYFRSETIMVRINVPGEKWEVEFFADGHIEVEIFKSWTGVEGEEVLQRLFDENGI